MSTRSLRYNTMNRHLPKSRLASTDRDALAFLEAATIYNENHQRAIIELVRRLKSAGLWTKMKAIYPLIGGTASSHKWNLKDPRDVNAAFRLTFSGGWTHSSTGASPNGTTAYANTYCTPASNLVNNSTHISYYSRTDAKSGAPVYVGTGTDVGTLTTYTSPIPLFQLVVRGDYGGVAQSSSSHYKASDEIKVNQSTGLGLFTTSRINSTSHIIYRNNTNIGSSTVASAEFTRLTFPFYIAARNDANSPYQYSNKQSAFISIGDGLTDTDVANLYNIVDLYQKRLGRAV